MNDTQENTLLRRYQRLIEISRDLASTLDLDTLLHRIVKVAADLSQAEESSILLYDEAQNELYFQAATNQENPAFRGLAVPVDQSIAGWIVIHREPLIIRNARDDKRHYEQINQLPIVATESLLGVPMIHKGKVIGVLEAINKKDGDFDAEDQELLFTLGAQAAVAIENARLFQQSDLISEFVHELRTPLASINTAAHLLSSQKLDDAKKARLIEAVQTETTRLSDLATSFLDIARLESGRTQLQIEPCDLTVLLSECASLMQAQAQDVGLRLLTNLPEDLAICYVDCDKIKQAILNLLSNAIKYNQPNGEIILSAQNHPNQVEISVSDTGIGIPEDALPKLFTKFYRVPGADEHAQGTGLGLSIVQRIVESHGGTINVDSVSGVGTTFTIRFPLTLA